MGAVSFIILTSLNIILLLMSGVLEISYQHALHIVVIMFIIISDVLLLPVHCLTLDVTEAKHVWTLSVWNLPMTVHLKYTKF